MIFVGKTDIGLVRDSNQDRFVWEDIEEAKSRDSSRRLRR